MNESDITLEALSGESQLNSADAERTADTASSEALTLAELNQYLGKDFKNKEAALKSFKDTFSYVGKKKEDIEREVKTKFETDQKTDQLAKELAELRRERFFDKNPQYADPAVRKIIESLGGEPHDVVERPEFKDVFTRVAKYEEVQKMNTVLESNPRLAQTKDALQKAAELKQTTGKTDAVEDLVARAVLGIE